MADVLSENEQRLAACILLLGAAVCIILEKDKVDKVSLVSDLKDMLSSLSVEMAGLSELSDGLAGEGAPEGE